HSLATAEGANPVAALTTDSSGNLYGTAKNGGANGLGSLFEITTEGMFTTLYSFGTNAGDGSNPRRSASNQPSRSASVGWRSPFRNYFGWRHQQHRHRISAHFVCAVNALFLRVSSHGRAYTGCRQRHIRHGHQGWNLGSRFRFPGQPGAI